MKHTPTPWNNDSPHGAVNITASNGRLICSTGGYSDNFTPNVHETNEANAAHIVKCVKLHEELVEALEALLDEKELPKHETWPEAILKKAKPEWKREARGEATHA